MLHQLTVLSVLVAGPNRPDDRLVHLSGSDPTINLTVVIDADNPDKFAEGEVYGLELTLVPAEEPSVFSGTSTGFATPDEEPPSPPSDPPSEPVPSA